MKQTCICTGTEPGVTIVPDREGVEKSSGSRHPATAVVLDNTWGGIWAAELERQVQEEDT